MIEMVLYMHVSASEFRESLKEYFNVGMCLHLKFLIAINVLCVLIAISDCADRNH